MMRLSEMSSLIMAYLHPLMEPVRQVIKQNLFTPLGFVAAIATGMLMMNLVLSSAAPAEADKEISFTYKAAGKLYSEEVHKLAAEAKQSSDQQLQNVSSSGQKVAQSQNRKLDVQFTP